METPSHSWASMLVAALELALALLAVAFVAVLAARWRASRRVGPVLAREQAPRGVQRAVLTLMGVALAGLVVHWEALPGALVAPVLALTGMVWLLSPGPGDAAVGERGVRRGWSARGFEAIEEWRLTGEHLRWRLRGQWLACRVPPGLQPALRERLMAACGDRQSPFRD